MSDSQTENLYHLILGLPEDVTSPNDYELLGLDQRTGDAETIKTAAADQNRKLLSWQNSDRYADVRKLTLEVVRARDLLLNEESRSAYDAGLGDWGLGEGPWIVEDPPPKKPAATEPLSVQCPDCRAEFKLRNRALIGRRVPCPECGFRFTIRPAPEPETIVEFEPEWIEDDEISDPDWDAELENLDNFDNMEELPPKSDRPRQARDSRNTNDRDIFDIADWDDEPHSRAERSARNLSRRDSRPPAHRSSARRSKSSSKSSRIWILWAGGVVLTIAVVSLAVLLIKGTSSSSAAGQDRLAYLPAGCRAVGFFRLGDVSRSAFFQSHLAGAPKLRAAVDQFRGRTGMEVSDLESVVIGLYDDNPEEFSALSVLMNVPRNRPFVLVARANKDWDRTKLIGGNTESREHAGETYHLLSADHNSPGRWGLYLADPRTLVLGTESEVKAAIDTGGQAPDWADMEFVQPEYHVVTARVPGPGQENVGPSPPGMPIGMQASTLGTGLQLDGDEIKHVTFLKFASSGEASQYISVLEQSQEQFKQLAGSRSNPPAFGSPTFRQFGRTVAVARGGLGDLGGMVGGTTAFAPLPFLARLGGPTPKTPQPAEPNPMPIPDPPIVQEQQSDPQPEQQNLPPPVAVVKNPNPPVPEQLGAPPDAATLDALLADLQEGQGFKAKNAARRLAKMQPDPARKKEVARILESLVVSGGHFDKQAAADALGVWGDAETVPFLLAHLDDKINKDIFLKKRVLVALGKLKDPRALVPMIEHLKNVHVRREAAGGLKQFGSAAEPELLKALAASGWQSQQTICDLLKDIGTARSLPDLDALARTGHVFVRSRARTAADAIRAGGK